MNALYPNLATCPFCKEDCIVTPDRGGFFIHCYSDLCGYLSPVFATESEAISAHSLVSRSAEHLRIAVEALEYYGGLGVRFGLNIGNKAHDALARIKASDTDTKGENNA